ncbi:tyrosine-type recombinase/integrase [Pseudomonas fluorescens]|uniref:Integrase n=1 Tax=Pseudomonas fluorescens TaxID=294 RepID=A0A5E7U2V1_PSEFL|nr:integrase family protein [Pseudomonas fluorescens]VVQ05171.1 hypothetical protein PS928_02976 [Pseudomonas fluorescens]
MSSKRASTEKIQFTIAALDALPLPEPGTRVTYHDKTVSGLQIRVTSNGTKTFYVFMRVNGKPERVKVGEHTYPEMTIDQARKKAKAIIHQIAEGQSPAAAKREDKAKGLTLAKAVDQYVTEKHRESDGLLLKPRTVDGYLKLLKPSRLTATGKRTKGGPLARLADKPIYKLTADEIKKIHSENLKLHGERQSACAMVLLKAVLRFYGIKIAQDPFDKNTREVDRIHIMKSGVAPREPVEHLLTHLGEWWRALHALPQSAVSDYIAFLALTGCRPGEPLKILVGDLVNGEIRLRDTKNRLDHVLLLSRQALAIAERNASGKAATDKLFPITPAKANELAHELPSAPGVPFTPKMLRSLFASIADELVSASTLKTLMNHKSQSVTDRNYIRKQKIQLAEAWQKVADHIEAVAADNVVPLFKSN